MNDLIERMEHAAVNTAAMAELGIAGTQDIVHNQILIMNALVLILRRQSNEDKLVLDRPRGLG